MGVCWFDVVWVFALLALWRFGYCCGRGLIVWFACGLAVDWWLIDLWLLLDFVVWF